MKARHLLEELRNVSKNEPLFPGDTISHATANELSAMGWIRRIRNGDFVMTDAGRAVLSQSGRRLRFDDPDFVPPDHPDCKIRCSDLLP